jgi:hypothetical protein
LCSALGQAEYFSTPEFSLAYTRHFKLNFPFAFEDTFSYNTSTSKFEATPLFERYHRDLRHWGMEESFFESFPELRGSMGGAEFGVIGEMSLEERGAVEDETFGTDGMCILQSMPCV